MTRRIDPRDFGAKGDGRTVDTEAIRGAIAVAEAGDIVSLSKGHYLSFTIGLKSHLHLELQDGCVLEAADPARHGGTYEAAEANPFDLWQDFGHSHWRNSLIHAIDVENVTISGAGMIDGRGLTREGPGSRWRKQAGEFPESMRGMSAAELAVLSPDMSAMEGLGNKAIALCRSRCVTLRDFTIVNGGHFALLATGVDDLRLENLLIDTNRDGIDIDGCRRVTVRGCRVNTPNDDAIVLKSSFALGERLPCEDVLIAHCAVSGFDPGTLLDGTKGRTQAFSPDRDRVTGRIKIGTESSGDFRRIKINHCTFERSRGLALETVDGGVIEDVEASHLTLHDVTTAPIFLRLGARLRAPEGATPGAIRRVVIRDVAATDILPDYSALIMGLPDHPIEDVTLERVRLSYRGGGTTEDAARTPSELADAYPEPSMFGRTPAYGLCARHVRGLKLDAVEMSAVTPDARPQTVFEDVTLAE
ncbi:glycosyl hydrolase family 28-related protein [Asticcacaulis sp. EMRT-3]|uniref:rhamnogalacturonidase n=1 Tax=Asticcacaulis sp. EMRT-3 TaxID=3040349 RepID=UPI0024AFAE2B|nr:glycosyl hydrolase family 28-related protein [Asticcacaulis sp. EMRT-3]MDI7776430.1 glycosyl hydrolase family 28-related protein [Asticcacaulis sp. EMRT-3]